MNARRSARAVKADALRTRWLAAEQTLRDPALSPERVLGILRELAPTDRALRHNTKLVGVQLRNQLLRTIIAHPSQPTAAWRFLWNELGFAMDPDVLARAFAQVGSPLADPELGESLAIYASRGVLWYDPKVALMQGLVRSQDLARILDAVEVFVAAFTDVYDSMTGTTDAVEGLLEPLTERARRDPSGLLPLLTSRVFRLRELAARAIGLAAIDRPAPEGGASATARREDSFPARAEPPSVRAPRPS